LNYLKESFERENLSLPENFYKDIENYISLLKKWNKIHNVTRMSEKDILISIVDSIIPMKFVDFETLLDIGSGAGFPAIPIAIMKREKRVILVEPIKKKSAFLHYVKSELSLSNVEIFSKRVEELQIEKVDLVTSRAVTETKTLLEISKNVVKRGGKLLFYKGSNLQNEIDQNLKNWRVENRGNRNYLIVEV
jgi:16S rRNA (guanine527-N7)-methyltransferase